MKLLIVTQKVDGNDPEFSFFCRWIIEFAKHAEHVTVICLGEGSHELPANVTVLSLGKEEKQSRLRYAVRLYRYMWRERKNYDAVFVHMNQEYILLGGIFWKMLGKRIYMWRNHYAGSMLTDLAASLCDKVFCTSRFSYTAQYKKTVLMPVGVDGNACRPDELVHRIPRSILFLGRLDESKRPDVLLDALGLLALRGIAFSATFVGSSSNPNSGYPGKLYAQVKSLHMSDHVKFAGAVPNREAWRYYRTHDIFVNCSKSGMLDKTIFEAAACGCMVLAASLDFADFTGQRFAFPKNDPAALSEKLIEFLTLPSEERAQLAAHLSGFARKHDLSVLGDRLFEAMGA